MLDCKRDRLDYGDRFSIVAYDDDVRVLVRSESLEDRRHARNMIDRLYPGGSTNLGAGLMEGYEQVRRHFIAGGINRVLILSDGLAYAARYKPSAIIDLAKSVMAAEEEPKEVIGVGVGNVDDA